MANRWPSSVMTSPRPPNSLLRCFNNRMCRPRCSHSLGSSATCSWAPAIYSIARASFFLPAHVPPHNLMRPSSRTIKSPTSYFSSKARRTCRYTLYKNTVFFSLAVRTSFLPSPSLSIKQARRWRTERALSNVRKRSSLDHMFLRLQLAFLLFPESRHRLLLLLHFSLHFFTNQRPHPVVSPREFQELPQKVLIRRHRQRARRLQPRYFRAVTTAGPPAVTFGPYSVIP